jgi:hypothetical protein
MKPSNLSNGKADQTVSEVHFNVSEVLAAILALGIDFDPYSSQSLLPRPSRPAARKDTPLLNLHITQTTPGTPLAIHHA